MRKLSVNTFVSLDGVMQAPGGPEEDPSGGFAHGGWSVNYWDQTMMDSMDGYMGKPFDLLLGRRTYEIFAAHWPNVTDDPAADALNGAAKHVASRTLDKVEWRNSTLIDGDVVEYVRRLKEREGPEIQVHGSGDLIQTLLRHELIDELRVWIFPVLLGEGKRLFAAGTVPGSLKLASSQVSKTGVVLTTYEPAGDIDYGSFALQDTGS